MSVGLPDLQLDLGPVIETRSLYFATAERKTKGFDQMKFGAGRKTGTPDVAGIPMDLRLNQYHVTLCFHEGVSTFMYCGLTFQRGKTYKSDKLRHTVVYKVHSA
jgi:hypothetical protein